MPERTWKGHDVSQRLDEIKTKITLAE